MRKRLQARQVKEPTGSRVATDLYCQSRFEASDQATLGTFCNVTSLRGYGAVGVKKAWLRCQLQKLGVVGRERAGRSRES